jgi:hypothetical protein
MAEHSGPAKIRAIADETVEGAKTHSPIDADRPR